MNQKDTLSLLQRIGVVKITHVSNDEKEVSIEDPSESIHRLMNHILQCMGALRNLVVEEESKYIEKNCCDMDEHLREHPASKSKRLVRETFARAVSTMSEMIVFAHDIKEDNNVLKSIVESYPWEQSFEDSGWCMAQWATLLLYDEKKPEDKVLNDDASVNSADASNAPQGEVVNLGGAPPPPFQSDPKASEKDNSTVEEALDMPRINQVDRMKEIFYLCPDAKYELDRFGQSILAYAIASNSITFVQLIVENYPELVRVRDGVGKYPVHYCARYSSSMEILRYIMSLHESPQEMVENAVDDFGNLPLHEAAHGATNIEVVQELLFLHPDAARIPNKDGKLPFHLAMRNECVDIVKLIYVAYPMAVSAGDSRGWIPIHHAAYYSKSCELIKFLHSCYADGVSTPNEVSGRYASHYAAVNCQSVNVLKLILGLFPEGGQALDRYRRLPLHNVVARCDHFDPRRIRCMQVLLKHYPMGSACSGLDGFTPYDIAKRDNLGNFVKYLLLKTNPFLDKARYIIYEKYVIGEIDNLESLKDLDNPDYVPDIDDEFFANSTTEKENHDSVMVREPPKNTAATNKSQEDGKSEDDNGAVNNESKKLSKFRKQKREDDSD